MTTLTIDMPSFYFGMVFGILVFVATVAGIKGAKGA